MVRHARLQADAALEASDMATADLWLDRARRFAPGDPAIALERATLALRRADAGAARTLFGNILKNYDLREAWLGLATAQSGLGRHKAAAASLAVAFSRHAGPLDGAVRTMATALARSLGRPGWCAALPDGRLTVVPVDQRRPRFTLDGRPVRPNRESPGIYRLPDAFWRAETLAVTIDGDDLLGSSIRPSAIRRIDGLACVADGGLTIQAWYPADPETDPELTIRIPVRAGSGIVVRASESSPTEAGAGPPFARPRHVTFATTALGDRADEQRDASTVSFSVESAEGETLLGCPLAPFVEQRVAIAAARIAATIATPGRPTVGQRPQPMIPTLLSVPADIGGPSARPTSRTNAAPLIVVVPVMQIEHGPTTAIAALSGIGAIAGVRLLVVDATGQRAAIAADDLRPRRGIISAELIRLTRRGGVADCLNAAIRHADAGDLLLLPTGTRMSPPDCDRIAEAARSAPDIGTVSPVIIDARPGSNDRPASVHNSVEIGLPPSDSLLIRRSCIESTGLFRASLFADGPGAVDDFCVRARHLGWRHLLATCAFAIAAPPRQQATSRLVVAPAALAARNTARLRRLHPGIDELRERAGAPAAAEARRCFDAQRWKAADDGRPCVVQITHDRGGGVERFVRERSAMLRARGRRTVVLRPARSGHGEPASGVGDGSPDGFPALVYLAREFAEIVELLGTGRVEAVEFHHPHGHDPAIFALAFQFGAPVDVFIHDYILFCPRIALVGAERRYCGEPALRHCEACIADVGPIIEEDIAVAALRARAASLLGRARRVIAPSHDVAARIAHHFPRITPVVEPWEDDTAISPFKQRHTPGDRPPGDTVRVAVIGAIGLHKGYDVLLACAREAARSGLNLFFTVIGHTIDDRRLMATGRVFVTGPFAEGEAEALIRLHRNDVALLPSIWPETWCFTLTEAWRAGLAVVAFDIGTPAERIRRTGGGTLLPLGATPKSVNNALLALAGGTRHE